MENNNKIARCFKVFNNGDGAKALKHLEEKFSGKFVRGNQEETYANGLQAEVVEYIKRLASVAKKTGEDENV